MKVALGKNVQKKQFDAPPIPLERPDRLELDKHHGLVVKLRTDPADADSQTYGLHIPYFSDGDPEEWLLFQRDLLKAIVGQNATTGPPKYRMARRLLQGDALATFDAAAATHGNETNDHFTQCLRDLTAHIFPQRCLQAQKCFMRRYMRKPIGMKMRSYVARVRELNSYLPDFPPFGANQSMDNDELIDLLFFGTPNSWRRQFLLQDFDPVDHTINDLVQFCERLELVEEDPSQQKVPRKTETSTTKTSKKRRGRTSSEKEEPKEEKQYCLLHSLCSHMTDDCRVLKAQAKKLKSASNTQKSKDGSNNKHGKTREELHTIVEASVAKALKGIQKKRKRDTEEESLNINEIDLEGLNFDDSESE